MEFSAFVAVPLAGMTLAQLGAEVVRVDPIGGGVDYGRWPVTSDGKSLYWASLNKGKQSVVVDLKSSAGQQLVLALAADSGVVITNLPYPWLTYEALRTFREDVLFVRLTGNPDGSPAVDYTVNAAAGFPLVTGPDHRPVNHVLPAWDLIAGHLIVTAVLAAERRRLLTGEGQEMSVSLADVAFASTANLGFFGEVDVNDADRPGIGNHLYGTYGVDFATGDGRRVEVVAITRRHWRALVEVTQTAAAISELERAEGVDFNEEGNRFVHRAAITELFAPWFLAREFPVVAENLNGAGVLWGPYQSFRQLVENDPRVAGNPMFSSVTHPGIAPTLAPATPITYGERAEAAPAPELGADTRTTLADHLGLSQQRLDELIAAGVIP